MKQTIIFALSVFITVCSVFGQDTPLYDDLAWGSTINQVENKYGKLVYMGSGEGMGYIGTKAYVPLDHPHKSKLHPIFVFLDNSFIAVSVNYYAYMYDANSFIDEFINMYGKPEIFGEDRDENKNTPRAQSLYFHWDILDTNIILQVGLLEKEDLKSSQEDDYFEGYDVVYFNALYWSHSYKKKYEKWKKTKYKHLYDAGLMK